MSDQIGRQRSPSHGGDDVDGVAPGGRLGRRALMLGAAAAGAGVAVGLVAGAEPAGAANGGNVRLGASNNTASSSTIVTTSSGNGLQGATTDDGASGVCGLDSSDEGAYGVQGTSDIGTGVFGTTSNGTGVLGQAGDGTGVLGYSSGDGQMALVGQDASTDGGYGAYLQSPAGIALAVDGTASFSTCGVASVDGSKTHPKSSVTVKGVSLSSSTLVLATPQGSVAGVCVQGVTLDISQGSFIIDLTAAVEKKLNIAWFAIATLAPTPPRSMPARPVLR
jgi:hypothetical protein